MITREQYLDSKRKREELLNAKRKLYATLLDLPDDLKSDQDLCLMHVLSIDRQIQQFISNVVMNEHSD
jgi:hypothetical protein